MERSKLEREKDRLSVQRTKLARLSNQGDMEEETKEIEKAKAKRDSTNRFDLIFKMVIIGDAVLVLTESKLITICDLSRPVARPP